MITFPDFYETIAQNVHVYHSDIRGLHGHTVLLEKGDEVQADVLLCGTGWRNDFLYFSDAEKARLGLPQQLEDADPNVEGTWAALETAADAEVLRRFPNLRNVPATPRATAVKTPYRLYRGIAPLDDTSIAFLSLVNTTNSFLTAECQVLWAVALLDGNLKLPPPEKMRENVAFVTAWSRRRYPTRGCWGTISPLK
ncbi:hypothetical protein H2203_002276 [Taxawa tesnikishii (nom. ined.)]|nr:hypothetical protein H2203_002276 [Dothideales sp. JES 119]